MIVVDAVTHRFGERVVVRDISLRLTQRRVGVIGANGSGKSTFARMLNGLVHPSEGTVTVNGLDTVTRGREVRRQVGFCFTNPDAQIVMPTVSEDVAFSLRRSGLPREEVAERVTAALARFSLAEHATDPAHILSGGEKQLLALASILVMEPAVLVCDEPTTLLDLRHASRVHGILSGLAQQVVLVTHHLDLVRDFDRVLVFDEGRVVCDDVPEVAVPAYLRLMR